MKNLACLFALIFSTFSVFAQTTNSGNRNYDDQGSSSSVPKENPWFYGGNFGLSFGNITYINLSPLVGYRLTEKLSVGVGGTYIYYREKYNNPSYQFSTSMYGGSVFTRYMILDNVFLHLEDEAINAEFYDPFSTHTRREWANSILGGGGFMQRLGDRGAFTITALYILNYNENKSIYPGPLVLRVGFVF